MRLRRWNELFALFFDPRVPLTFVLGSLALAIASSSLYSLLSTWIGAEPLGQLWLLLGSMAVVMLTVIILRQSVHFWVRRQSSSRLIIPENEQVQPQKSLILPVGLNPKGAEQAIIAYHSRNSVLRHCWLLVTEQVVEQSKFGDLRQLLFESNVEVHVINIENVRDASASYKATQDAIRAARAIRDALPLVVDITSGTTVMSVGMTLAAREQHMPVQYYAATYRADTGAVNPESATAPALVAFVQEQEAST